MIDTESAWTLVAAACALSLVVIVDDMLGDEVPSRPWRFGDPPRRDVPFQFWGSHGFGAVFAMLEASGLFWLFGN